MLSAVCPLIFALVVATCSVLGAGDAPGDTPERPPRLASKAVMPQDEPNLQDFGGLEPLPMHTPIAGGAGGNPPPDWAQRAALREALEAVRRFQEAQKQEELAQQRRLQRLMTEAQERRYFPDISTTVQESLAAISMRSTAEFFKGFQTTLDAIQLNPQALEVFTLPTLVPEALPVPSSLEGDLSALHIANGEAAETHADLPTRDAAEPTVVPDETVDAGADGAAAF